MPLHARLTRHACALGCRLVRDRTAAVPAGTAARSGLQRSAQLFHRATSSSAARGRAQQVLPVRAMTGEAPPPTPAAPLSGGNKNPIVQKISEALLCSGVMEGTPFDSVMEQKFGEPIKIREALAGDESRTAVNVWWDKERATLVVAFRAPKELQEMQPMLPKYQQAVKPKYLAKYPDAKAEASQPVVERLEGVQGQIEAALTNMVPQGDLASNVRRVLVTGYAHGGALAAVAAPWLALLMPVADVRCITFNAPGVGNAEFARISSWLVGLAYRDDNYEDAEQGALLRLGVHTPFPLQLPKEDSGLKFADMPVHKLDKQLQPPKADAENTVNLLTSQEREDFENQPQPGGVVNAVASRLFVANAFENAAPKQQTSLDRDMDVENVGIPPQYRDTLDGYIEGLVVSRMQPLSILASAAYADPGQTNEVEVDEGPLKGKVKKTVLGFHGLTLYEEEEAKLVQHAQSDAQCYVIWRPFTNPETGARVGTVILAFRGTSSKQDALIDARAWRDKVEVKNQAAVQGYVHSGFLKQLDRLVSKADNGDTIPRVVAGMAGDVPVGRVICTGHSLGAALSTLGAAWAALQWPEADIRCYSFASPHVGDAEAVACFEKLVGSHARAMYRADIVPRLLTFTKYRHADPAIRLSGRGKVQMPWHNIPISNIFHLWIPNGVANHNMDNYKESVQFKEE